MAGVSAYYYVGEPGGFNGSDGIVNLDLQIMVCEGNRMWLEPKYYTNKYRPICETIRSFVPKGPDDPNQDRIAMILYASNLFESCPSFQKVKAECEGMQVIDFCDEKRYPKHFYDLLEESKQVKIDYNEVEIDFAILSTIHI